MPRAFGFVVALIALGLLMLGCGGSDGGAQDGPMAQPVESAPGTRGGYAVLANPGYNGRLTNFNHTASSVEETSAGIEVALVQGTRRLTLSIPTHQIRSGDVFTIEGDGASATYLEGTRRWRASSGTVQTWTVDGRTFAGHLNLGFAPDPEERENLAQGGFRLEGAEYELPKGRDEGPGVVTFTADPGIPTSAILDAFGSMASDGVDYERGLTLGISEPIRGDAKSGARGIQVSLPPTAAPGDVFTFGTDGRRRSERVEYWEWRGETPTSWSATGGSCRVTARSPSHLTVELIGVDMEPNGDSSPRGTGRFRLDGFVRR